MGNRLSKIYTCTGDEGGQPCKEQRIACCRRLAGLDGSGPKVIGGRLMYFQKLPSVMIQGNLSM